MSATGGAVNQAAVPGSGAIEIQASSGDVGAQAAVATLAAAAGKTTWISGFSVTGLGSTAGNLIIVTITGPTTTLSYDVLIPSNVNTEINRLIVEFARPIPASAQNTAIVVTAPSFGAGNAHACVTAHGFQTKP